MPDDELATLIERSPIGMYRAHLDGSLVHVNPALARMLGYASPGELLAKNLDRDIYVDPAQRVRVPTGVVDRARVRWKRRDGAQLEVHVWGHATESDPPQFAAWAVDVTALASTSDELRKTAEILEFAMSQIPAIYWTVDRDLRIVRTGGAVERLLGYPANRFLGSSLVAAHAIETGTADPMVFHQRALRGETVQWETEYTGKCMSNSLAPQRGPNGEIVGAIGTCIDVTAPRQLERRMIEAQRAESLGVLAGGLAHDFNNLLVAVIGSADLALREIGQGAPGRAAIENIRDAGLRAAELTRQLLAYAGRAGAGTTGVALAPLVDELLRIAGATIPPGVRVELAVPAGLAVRADPGQLRQVLHNLLINACEAIGSAGGTIAIRAGAIDHDGRATLDDPLAAAPGRYVALEVADNGPGIARDLLRRVFEPFFTTKHTGHGLGLAAVLGIVRAHGGGIRVRTAPGAGTTIEALWPIAAEEPAHAATPATATVLVVDDEDLVRDVVVRMIEDLGYSALPAASGAAALALLDHHAVDAVLVDLTMPMMSGVDVIAAVRARRPGLPVVLCSGFDRDGRGSGAADAYLPKPFRIEALERTLAKLLPLRSV